ncbi:MAG: metallophosphoesterase [Pseudosphingobacterium sp.]|nr:metallophosphoesterase [Pseudosphingobacterium sp.]
MRLQIVSDLHLEFPENSSYLNSNPLIVSGDVLLMAGDIVPLISIDSHKAFFDFVSDNFAHTYWLPGNHEYYYSDINCYPQAFEESIRDNVTLLNNQTITLGKLRLHFSTLWSQISEETAFQIQHGMSDFRLIKYEGYTLTPERYNKLHQISVDFLKASVRPGSDAFIDIVVTHHVPTFKQYPAQYSGSILNEGFATELRDFIAETNAAYWIHGHHHVNVPEFMVGRTIVLTNQLGYVRYNEHNDFSHSKTILFDM